MNELWDSLFGCAHRRTSFPITLHKNGPGGKRLGEEKETYTVCLECGEKFPYSWEQMKMVRKSSEKPATAPHGIAAWLARHRWSSRGT